MMLAACLLIAIASLFKYFPGKNNILSLVPKEGGRILCEGRIERVDDYKSFQKFSISRLYCLKHDSLKPVAGKVLLTLKKIESPEKVFLKNDIVRFRASIRRPRDFKNFNRSTNENFCLSHNIDAVGYIPNENWIVKLGAHENYLPEIIDRWRLSVEEGARTAAKNDDVFALIKALTLGDKKNLDSNLRENLQILGIVHLIVVSGLHVAVLAILVWWFIVLFASIFSPLMGQRDVRVAACMVTLLIVWLFVALTGFGTPAVRAGVLVTVYLSSILFRRVYSIWNSLSIAVILLVIINPHSIYDISFQLTFSAVIGIVVFSKYFFEINNDETFIKRMLLLIGNSFLVSVGASLAVYPLLSYHFGNIPAIGPVVNIVFAPIITFLVVPLAVAASITVPFSVSLAHCLFFLVRWPAQLFIYLSDRLAYYLEWSFVEFELSFYGTLTLYGFILTFIFWRRLIKRRLASVLAVVTLSLGLIMSIPLHSEKGKLSVTFLDVGQGASVVVKSPTGRVVIIDGGGVKGSDFDLGESVIAPYLERMDIEKVDRIIVTHPHPDHFMGLGYIAENYSPEKVVTGSFPEGDLADDDRAEWDIFLRRLKDAKVKIGILKTGLWHLDGVEFNVLSPPAEIPESWNVNDASGVIKITYGMHSFLITGDMEDRAEKHLVQNKADLESTVLQVPHHGSSTSSGAAFLKKAASEYAVIQVGAFNKYGFPNEEVLDRLEKYNIKTYRTDVDGAVKFITNGTELELITAEPRS